MFSDCAWYANAGEMFRTDRNFRHDESRLCVARASLKFVAVMHVLAPAVRNEWPRADIMLASDQQ